MASNVKKLKLTEIQVPGPAVLNLWITFDHMLDPEVNDWQTRPRIELASSSRTHLSPAN